MLSCTPINTTGGTGPCDDDNGGCDPLTTCEVNDQGVLLHPDVAGDEVLLIEEVLGVPPMVGTVSFGSPYVGAGICASNDGAVAGSETTGPELNRIEDALGII